MTNNKVTVALKCVRNVTSWVCLGYVCQDVSRRWYIVLQCVACVAVCCIVLQRVVVRSVLDTFFKMFHGAGTQYCSVLHVLQHVVVHSVLDTFFKMFHGAGTFCCSVLQCVAACCSALQIRPCVSRYFMVLVHIVAV